MREAVSTAALQSQAVCTALQSQAVRTALQSQASIRTYSNTLITKKHNTTYVRTSMHLESFERQSSALRTVGYHMSCKSTAAGLFDLLLRPELGVKGSLDTSLWSAWKTT